MSISLGQRCTNWSGQSCDLLLRYLLWKYHLIPDIQQHPACSASTFNLLCPRDSHVTTHCTCLTALNSLMGSLGRMNRRNWADCTPKQNDCFTLIVPSYEILPYCRSRRCDCSCNSDQLCSKGSERGQTFPQQIKATLQEKLISVLHSFFSHAATILMNEWTHSSWKHPSLSAPLFATEHFSTQCF